MFAHKTKSYTFDLENRIKRVCISMSLNKFAYDLPDAIQQKCCTYNKFQNQCSVFFSLKTCT